MLTVDKDGDHTRWFLQLDENLPAIHSLHFFRSVLMHSEWRWGELYNGIVQYRETATSFRERLDFQESWMEGSWYKKKCKKKMTRKKA